MAWIEEMNHLMDMDSKGIELYNDGRALSDRISEWLSTPQGTVADHPAWGNNLFAFQHEPPGTTLNVMLEMSIIEKLPIDIRDLLILGISAEFEEIDYAVITIRHQLGTYTGELRL